MKRIVLSLMTVVMLLALTAGATSAVFTSQAKVVGNTWSTGKLEIRIDKQVSIPGFVVDNSVPGDKKTGGFEIENYNLANFGGTSTLPAKSIKISAVRTLTGHDSEKLYDKLRVKIKSTVGWNTVTVFTGDLEDLVNKQILLPGNTLPIGWSMPMEYEVSLPDGLGNDYQGLTTRFDFVVDAASS